jgi:hypothetical protein
MLFVVQNLLHLYSPVGKTRSLRILIAIAAHFVMRIFQFDVDTAFLHADYGKEVYIKPPEQFFNHGNKFWRLKRSLYGMRDAPLLWFNHYRKHLEGNGFTSIKYLEPCLFYRHNQQGLAELVFIHVDDNIAAIAMNDEAQKHWDDFIVKTKNTFGIKEFPFPSFILGFNIKQDKAAVYLFQESFINKALEKFGFNGDRPYPCKIPASTNIRNEFLDAAELTRNDLKADQELCKQNNWTQNYYLQLVGTLLYASIMTRPDIAWVVQLLSRHMVSPRSTHFYAAIKVFGYLKATKRHGLVFPKANINTGSNKQLTFNCYTDADYAGDKSTSKSATGYVIFLNNCLIHWISKLQSYVAPSTVAAEYTAMSAATNELIWMKELLENIGMKIHTPMDIKGDNQPQIKLIAKQELATRNVRVSYHNVQHEHDAGTIAVEWIE